MKRVAVVDYGRGNLFSLSRALEHLGGRADVTADPVDIERAERLILPGVGAYGDGMAGLRERGLVEPLKRFASSGKPFLGICLGMQLLLSESEEFGRHEGLGLVPGRVVRFSADGWKIPHVGWNALSPAGAWAGTCLAGLTQTARMYFVHSYVAVPNDAGHRLAETRYGGHPFCSVLKKDNIEGCQFHPEKSGEEGLCLLKTWLNAN